MSVPSSSLAPTSDSSQKTNNSKKNKTSVQFDISNKSSLSDLAQKYTTATPAPEAPTPKLKSSYFEKLDMAVRMELDHGTQHIIDVQPDLRF